MGSRRLNKISDYHRNGYNLRVTCLGCGRVVVLDSLAISIDCGKRNVSRDMGRIQRRLACAECGGRNVKCGPVELAN
jgi:ribosomal protein S27E